MTCVFGGRASTGQSLGKEPMGLASLVPLPSASILHGGAMNSRGPFLVVPSC